MNRRSVGKQHEERATAFLESRGYQILERNFTAPRGEIDLIAEDEQYILFTEVKLRKSAAFAPARASVDRRKQARLRTTAELYLAQFPTGRQPRFDVAEVYAPEGTATRDPEIHYIEDAF